MNVLIGIDGSRYALGAARFVAEHLASDAETKVDLVYAQADTPAGLGARASRQTRDLRRIPPETRRILERAAKRLDARGFEIGMRARRGIPSVVVPELAAEGNYDLVVVAVRAVPALGLAGTI